MTAQYQTHQNTRQRTHSTQHASLSLSRCLYTRTPKHDHIHTHTIHSYILAARLGPYCCTSPLWHFPPCWTRNCLLRRSKQPCLCYTTIYIYVLLLWSAYTHTHTHTHTCTLLVKINAKTRQDLQTWKARQQNDEYIFVICRRTRHMIRRLQTEGKSNRRGLQNGESRETLQSRHMIWCLEEKTLDWRKVQNGEILVSSHDAMSGN
jgi:hypothetical protein